MFSSHWDELLGPVNNTSDLILFICFNVSGRVKTMFPQNKTKQKRFYMCRDQWFYFFFMFLDEWKQYYYYYFFKRFKKKINILCVGNIDIFFFFHVSVPVKTMFKKTWGPVKKNKSWWKIMFSLVGTCENNILKKINKFHVSGPVKNFFLFMCWGEEKKNKKSCVESEWKYCFCCWDQ